MKKYAANVRVYELEYGNNKIIRIRAMSESEAKWTAKRLIGAPIKTISTRLIRGCKFTAANDNEFED